MTNQEKKRFLQKYRTLDRLIDSFCMELSEWRSRAVGMGRPISDMPKTNSGENKLQKAIERVMEIEEIINAKINDLILARKEVENAINSVPDETLQLLLRYRYIDGRTWDQISVDLHYGYQWVCKLHDKALSQVKIKIEQAIESDTLPVI